jgi:hypothetical protein
MDKYNDISNELRCEDLTFKAMACCHGVVKINDEFVGD